jgi:hypothetical protein
VSVQRDPVEAAALFIVVRRDCQDVMAVYGTQADADHDVELRESGGSIGRYRWEKWNVPAALAARSEAAAPHQYDHDGLARHHHHDLTDEPVWWLGAEQFGGDRRDHRYRSEAAAPPSDLPPWHHERAFSPVELDDIRRHWADNPSDFSYSAGRWLATLDLIDPGADR